MSINRPQVAIRIAGTELFIEQDGQGKWCIPDDLQSTAIGKKFLNPHVTKDDAAHRFYGEMTREVFMRNANKYGLSHRRLQTILEHWHDEHDGFVQAEIDLNGDTFLAECLIDTAFRASLHPYPHGPEADFTKENWRKIILRLSDVDNSYPLEDLLSTAVYEVEAPGPHLVAQKHQGLWSDPYKAQRLFEQYLRWSRHPIGVHMGADETVLIHLSKWAYLSLGADPQEEYNRWLSEGNLLHCLHADIREKLLKVIQHGTPEDQKLALAMLAATKHYIVDYSRGKSTQQEDIQDLTEAYKEWSEPMPSFKDRAYETSVWKALEVLQD